MDTAVGNGRIALRTSQAATEGTPRAGLGFGAAVRSRASAT